MASSGEDALIARYFRPLAGDPGAFDLTDDAAILRSSADDLVVTTDAIVEGVHFLDDDPPDTIARKALRVNLSDLAAKGAAPAGFVLTLALRRADADWLAPFARALGEDAASFRCPLLGGDTVSTKGPLMISITAFGRVLPGRMVRRAGAEPGDHVVVTGTIGDATLGLDILTGGAAAAALSHHDAARDGLIARYRVPEPRCPLANAVRDHASAAMDISDGLAGDLIKLCASSEVSATIDVSLVPLSDAARIVHAAGAADIERLLAGGDDYELLCTIPDARIDGFFRDAAGAGIAVTRIGTIEAGPAPPRFVDGHGTPIALRRFSYGHFAGS